MVPADTRSSSSLRIDAVTFLTLFLTYAYFFQGGGWNQNARMDQIRALVEQERFSINGYMRYETNRETGNLFRAPIDPGRALDRIDDVANTGDVAKFEPDDLFYPNKPPGTTLLAAPAYWTVYRTQRIFGTNPDDWWIQTLNAWLVTVFSVGLLGALGGVVLRRTSRMLFPECPPWTHTATALTFGLGTLVLPFSTMLIDHVQVAVLLLLSFASIVRSRASSRAARWLFLGGLAAGTAVLVNYIAALVVIVLLAYALRGCRRNAVALVWLVTGTTVPLAILAWYHAACFGSPWTIVNRFQQELFLSEGNTLGVFGFPDLGVGLRLLFGTHRGLFFTSPVLLLSVMGLWKMLREPKLRLEAIVALASFAVVWLVNSAFNRWDAGFTVGPRYLIPALPFLALALTPAFSLVPRVSLGVAVLSACLMLTATAVDPQVPHEIDNPVTGYTLPLLRGETVTVWGESIRGPVSANPIGVYEAWYYRTYSFLSPRTRWSSFNVGELLWPDRRISVLPLALVLAPGIFLARRWS